MFLVFLGGAHNTFILFLTNKIRESIILKTPWFAKFKWKLRWIPIHCENRKRSNFTNCLITAVAEVIQLVRVFYLGRASLILKCYFNIYVYLNLLESSTCDLYHQHSDSTTNSGFEGIQVILHFNHTRTYIYTLYTYTHKYCIHN